METPTEKQRRVWDRTAPQYDRAMKLVERWWFVGGREWVCGRAEGDVLEVGIGTGLNLPYYPSDVRVTGVDLSPGMLAQARDRLRELSVDATLQEADAQALPFDDASFDSVVSTLVLCSVPDSRAAIREMRRVLRSGGRLLLLDHIGSTWWPVRVGQRLAEIVSVRSAGEYFTRRQLPQVVDAGFEVVETERLRAGTVERLHARKV
jgi:ubiquinone/menaquinone biosynthesis C-methylase UbiE